MRTANNNARRNRALNGGCLTRAAVIQTAIPAGAAVTLELPLRLLNACLMHTQVKLKMDQRHIKIDCVDQLNPPYMGRHKFL